MMGLVVRVWAVPGFQGLSAPDSSKISLRQLLLFHLLSRITRSRHHQRGWPGECGRSAPGQSWILSSLRRPGPDGIQGVGPGPLSEGVFPASNSRAFSFSGSPQPPRLNTTSPSPGNSPGLVRPSLRTSRRGAELQQLRFCHPHWSCWGPALDPLPWLS